MSCWGIWTSLSASARPFKQTNYHSPGYYWCRWKFNQPNHCFQGKEDSCELEGKQCEQNGVHDSFREREWVSTHNDLADRFLCSKNGWTNSDVAFDWLVRVFEPQTREKAAREKCFLILDGHSSHLSLCFLRKAQEFNIDIIVYPSHCTHLLQGLNVICFAPLK
jgi:hypothetical protein